MRKAVDEMAAENLLVRRQGKGTFVATHSDPRAFFRFLRLVPLSGEVEPSKSVPLECWRAKAGPEAARTLKINIGDPIIIIAACCNSPARRWWSTKSTCQEMYSPGFSLDVLKDHQGSLYSLFESRFGVRMIRAEERICAG